MLLGPCFDHSFNCPVPTQACSSCRSSPSQLLLPYHISTFLEPTTYVRLMSELSGQRNHRRRRRDHHRCSSSCCSWLHGFLYPARHFRRARKDEPRASRSLSLVLSAYHGALATPWASAATIPQKQNATHDLQCRSIPYWPSFTKCDHRGRVSQFAVEESFDTSLPLHCLGLVKPYRV